MSISLMSFSKAFEIMSHGLLKTKVKIYGFPDKAPQHTYIQKYIAS